jgi:hypothetical protein
MIYDLSIPSYGDLIAVAEFRDFVAEDIFTDYDGVGHASNGEMMAREAIYPSTISQIPEDATHIVWFNR